MEITIIEGISAIIPQTRPAIAIPFPPFLVSKAQPPKITASIPQIIPTTPKQLTTRDKIPKTIDAIASPLVGFDGAEDC